MCIGRDWKKCCFIYGSLKTKTLEFGIVGNRFMWGIWRVSIWPVRRGGSCGDLAGNLEEGEALHLLLFILIEIRESETIIF